MKITSYKAILTFTAVDGTDPTEITIKLGASREVDLSGLGDRLSADLNKQLAVLAGPTEDPRIAALESALADAEASIKQSKERAVDRARAEVEAKVPKPAPARKSKRRG